MHKRVYAVVLAAGSGRRFGTTKQLASYGERSLVSRACRLAESVCGSRSLLVTGADHLAVIEDRPVGSGFFVINEAHESGLASSIASGIAAIAPLADYALLLLADQPLITTAHLEDLVNKSFATPDTIIATAFDGVVGPPVIFPNIHFDQLIALQGDQGARALLQMPGNRVTSIRFADAAVDIDTVEDLAQLP